MDSSTPSVFSDDIPGTLQQFRKTPFCFPKPTVPVRRNSSAFSKLSMPSHTEPFKTSPLVSSPLNSTKTSQYNSSYNQSASDDIISNNQSRNQDSMQGYQSRPTDTGSNMGDTSRRTFTTIDRNITNSDSTDKYSKSVNSSYNESQDYKQCRNVASNKEQFRHHPDSVLRQPENVKRPNVLTVQKSVVENGDAVYDRRNPQCNNTSIIQDRRALQTIRSESREMVSKQNSQERGKSKEKVISKEGASHPKQRSSNSNLSVDTNADANSFNRLPAVSAKHNFNRSKSTEIPDSDKSVHVSRCSINLVNRASQARCVSTSNISHLNSPTSASNMKSNSDTRINKASGGLYPENSDQFTQLLVQQSLGPISVSRTSNNYIAQPKPGDQSVDSETKATRQRILQNVRGRQNEMGSPKTMSKVSSV